MAKSSLPKISSQPVGTYAGTPANNRIKPICFRRLQIGFKTQSQTAYANRWAATFLRGNMDNRIAVQIERDDDCKYYFTVYLPAVPNVGDELFVKSLRGIKSHRLSVKRVVWDMDMDMNSYCVVHVICVAAQHGVQPTDDTSNTTDTDN